MKPRGFGAAIRPAVEAELAVAGRLVALGRPGDAFSHLENAHVLGQSATGHHVRVHWRMLVWGWQQRDVHECLGQVTRLVGAATKTAWGWLPSGNTGGSRVSAFRPMPTAPALQAQIERARRLARR